MSAAPESLILKPALPQAASLSDVQLRAALDVAVASRRPPLEVLAETSGLDGDALAR